MATKYDRIAKLVSQIRNARFGEMVNHLEELIDSGIWQDFRTPIGTHFRFLPAEFDYFLAAQEIDPDVVRSAYLQAKDIEGLAAKTMRLADITGKGNHDKADRRDREKVADELASDPSGAAERIRKYGPVVTERTGKIAKDPARRKAVEAGQPVKREDPNQKRFDVRWHDDRTEAEAIVERLLKDPDLAHEVYDRLVTARKNGQMRRSEAQ